MLEEQPLDLSVRVGDYPELSREDISIDRDTRDINELKNQKQQNNRKDIDDYGNTTTRLRELVTTSSVEYGQIDDLRTYSEDSDDSCSDNNHKDGMRNRIRPPGTKPYKKNLMRRYREFKKFKKKHSIKEKKRKFLRSFFLNLSLIFLFFIILRHLIDSLN